MDYKHLMLDIETMGNEPYSAILSIAAVPFDLATGEISELKFYRRVSLQSCLDLGLCVSADTINWWMGEELRNARNQLMCQKESLLGRVLVDFTSFVNLIFEANGTFEIWGNSARFDMGILGDAYRKAKIPPCWDFRNERDVRTLVALNPNIKANYIYQGIAHDAHDDCLNQIAYCSKTFQSITIK
jgi:3' exoribonuclease, RNase T-like